MTIRAKLLPHNPNAVYMTSTGFHRPDGTFKPFADMRTPTLVPIDRKWWERRK